MELRKRKNIVHERRLKPATTNYKKKKLLLTLLKLNKGEKDEHTIKVKITLVGGGSVNRSPK